MISGHLALPDILGSCYGLHSFLAGKTLFENIIPCLSPEGMYIIEDVSLSDIKLYKNYFLKIDRLFEAKFVYLKSPLIKDEEAKIRKDPMAQVTDLLKKVFGAKK